MKKLLILQLFLSIFFMHAQESVLTTGGDASGSGGSTSYSIGQTVYLTKTGPNTSIAEGVQQPYEISVSLGVDETTIQLQMSVYPNPATSFLTLKVEENKGLTYQLYDELGRIIKKEKIKENTTRIHLSKMASATYFLSVQNKDKTIKIFKIIKR